jgi:hypothetical protein
MNAPVNDLIARARAVPIENELARRGIKLTGRGSERTGPCPVCGGTDRFAINTRKQCWNCRGCQRGGDVIDLTMHVDGSTFADATRTLTGESRPTYRPPAASAAKGRSPVDDNEEGSRHALQIWEQAQPIEDTLAAVYLNRRGLVVPDGVSGRSLRFHAACPFESATKACMVGLFRDIASDKPVAISRRPIGADGLKLGKPKFMGPVGGAAIKLTADEDVSYGLTIAEGIETALAGMMLDFRPAWVLGSSGAIARFPTLSGIEALTILVDHDEKGTGHRDATECSRRWTAAGREVRRVVPRCVGCDMADLGRSA